MSLSEICNRDPVVAYANTPLGQAARLMRERHVGSLVIVHERGGERIPVGMLTDRDIVVGTLAQDLDPRTLKVGEVMTREPLTIAESATIPDALSLMRERGIRRLPVVGERGALAGIVALDDLLAAMTEELSEFVRVVDWQRVREACLRR